MQIAAVISSHPHVQGNTNAALIHSLEECAACAMACNACADACLGEKMVQNLTQCIRLCLDCADICIATGTVATRRTGSNEEVIRQMLQACETACQVCATECDRHASMHVHCRLCAEACRQCEDACRQAMGSLH